ncbi:MAG: sigma-70 family RNA polymerase sigma factor [Aeromonas popoffii]|uniref:sigma-70 family RNA polymerase sigma factor n=1 Tax=Aeromonas popoffii TaxID=70856 RepID=UPI003F31970E
MAINKQSQFRTDRADLSLYLAHNVAHGQGATFTRITREELIELVVKAQNGDTKAREEVIRQTVRFVQDQIMRVRNSNKEKVEAEDLFQAGMMGLNHAIDKFDPSFGTSFLTHAGSWVFQSVIREIQNSSKFVRVPVHVWDMFRRLMAAGDVLAEEEGVHRSEIDFSKYSDEKLASMVEGEPHQIALIRQHFFGGLISSYDMPSFNSDGDEMENIISMMSDPEKGDNHLEEDLITDSETTRIRDMISLLGPRERYVLMRRHGIGRDGDYFTLDMIGAELGVTRERIRQIEVAATNILKRISSAYERGESIDSIRLNMGRSIPNKPFLVPSGVELTPEEMQIMKLQKSTPLPEPVSSTAIEPTLEQPQEQELPSPYTRRGRAPLPGPRYQGRVMPEWFDINNLRSAAIRKRLTDDELTREELFIRERDRAHQKAIQERLNARSTKERV